MSKQKTVLSLEQALTLPYATQRFVQLGWRVIRIESPGEKSGDPNRYIGEDTGVEDLHSYFIPPNLGKEGVTINLKKKEGQELLKKLIRELEIDVFLCNTLPIRYQQLGIDFENLKEANPDLIWCGISALGPDFPDRAGYDPALQAMIGYMHLTGEESRDPMLCGLPIIDLKAGDEAFSQVLLALLEQKDKPGGKRIDISMAQCAASWLITALPQLEFVEDPSKLFTRSGNEHRSFIPSNSYPTKDSFVYLAIGSNFQWKKLTEIPGFEHLAKTDRETNQGRLEDKENIYADMRKGLKSYNTADFIIECQKAKLAVAPVNSTSEVAKLDFIKEKMISTTLPTGKKVDLYPAMADTDYLNREGSHLPLPPRLGEHNNSVFTEAGLNKDEIASLKSSSVI